MRKRRSFASLVGQTYGRLSVIAYGGLNHRHQNRWECKCSCGTVKVVDQYCLRSGTTQSCGCLQKERAVQARTVHGNATRSVGLTPEYRAWRGMKRRCENPNGKDFQNYGGRGIVICERWHDFPSFLEDMGRRPSAKHSLDRINVNGNYEPGNCRWATSQEQSDNKRNILWIQFQGRKFRMGNLLNHFGINRHAVSRFRSKSNTDVLTALSVVTNQSKSSFSLVS